MTLPITDPVLIVAIAMAIFLVAPVLMQRLGVPGLIGLILAGAVVGPNALNLLARDQTIILLGTVGLLYLMFLAGIEIDLHGFRRYRNRSLVFGAITFVLPQVLGTGVGLALGYPWPAAILMASMFASHTLVAYPIAIRFGIAKNEAVTTAVGGTIITDTAALLVLAIVAASVVGELDALFWTRLSILLALYVALVWLALPPLARWFFRKERAGAPAEFVFVLAALFAGAYLAEVAGVEAIVGAFLVGLALNRLIPPHGLLNSRIHFVGEAIFIPFFLLSVGMLVDVRVLLAGTAAWQVMIGMTVTVTATKWLAARATERLFGYSREEGWTIFGLSVSQAAATLAATLIGFQIGLFDEAVLNGAILMILVTCIIGPWVVERYGRRMALAEEGKPYEPMEAPQRIVVPMANPATADALMDLAMAIREPDTHEPLYPLTVVPDGQLEIEARVAEAEKMLSHAVAYASAADVPVVPLTRMDHNFASGIARGVTETRASTLVVGWDGKPSAGRGIFGTVLDQLLESTRQHLLVAKLGHPLNTTDRLIVLVPRGADRSPGFGQAVRTLKLLASRLSAEIHGYTLGVPAEIYERHFRRTRPEAPISLQRAESWGGVLRRLREELRPDDLVVVLSARRGALAWHPAMDTLPGKLASLAPESFLMFYPSEVEAEVRDTWQQPAMPRVLRPQNVVVDLAGADADRAIEELLARTVGQNRRLMEMVLPEARRVARAFPTPVVAGVVILHVRTSDLPEPELVLGVSPEGLRFPGVDDPVHALFILLTDYHRPDEHLDLLSEIARFVGDAERAERLMRARSVRAVFQAGAATNRQEG